VDQADRLRAIASVDGSKNEARIISITSGKGGVGKTNIAANLACLFSKRGLKVLLIDADLGLANANLILGCRVNKTIDDVLFENAAFKDVFVRSNYGFDLLPSSSGMRRILELDNFSQRTLMDRLFETMENYDIVLYDTAPGIGNHVLNFNASAHDIVVIAHPEPTALADAYALIKVMATEKKEKRFKLLINRAQAQSEGLNAFTRLTDVSNEFLNISIDYLGALPEDPSVLAAVRSQKPVSLTAPRAVFSMALERVADKLLACSVDNLGKNRVLNRTGMGVGHEFRGANQEI
jgi:flagellar biosynthesis protein FlhG